MVVFLATQDSVEFHHSILQTTLNDHSDQEEDEEDDDSLELFKLHGEMPQKVIKNLDMLEMLQFEIKEG